MCYCKDTTRYVIHIYILQSLVVYVFICFFLFQRIRSYRTCSVCIISNRLLWMHIVLQIRVKILSTRRLKKMQFDVLQQAEGICEINWIHKKQPQTRKKRSRVRMSEQSVSYTQSEKSQSESRTSYTVRFKQTRKAFHLSLSKHCIPPVTEKTTI